MRIVLVNPRGFCAGVHMAIQVVDQLLDLVEGETVFVYHDIVHNTHVVQRFREQFGYTEADVVGSHVSSLFPGEVFPDLARVVLEHLARQGPFTIDVDAVRNDGTRFPCRLIGSRLSYCGSSLPPASRPVPSVLRRVILQDRLAGFRPIVEERF